jgi:hypothetical protein
MMELVRYDSMCRAIAECHAVDEVLDVKDKARALEVYAMQVRNIDAERKACDVRLRAERRVGELLKELQRATPQTANPTGANGHEDTSNSGTRPPTPAPSPYAEALQHNGISRQSAHRYQQLAEVPQATFEEALRDPVVKPSTTRIITQARDPVPRMSEEALWVWGRARDFERGGYARMDPQRLLDGMTSAMRADMRRIAPAMAEFFGAMSEVQHELA